MGTQDNNKKKSNKKNVKTKKLKFSRPPHKPSDVRGSRNGNNLTRGN
jgi:hypothetical protein